MQDPDPSSSDDSSDFDSSTGSKESKKRKGRNKDGYAATHTDGSAASHQVGIAAPKVVFTSHRQTWSADAQMTVGRLHKELQHCRDLQSKGYELPKAGSIIPEAAANVVELTLTEAI
jgi:hypothetical protein